MQHGLPVSQDPWILPQEPSGLHVAAGAPLGPANRFAEQVAVQLAPAGRLLQPAAGQVLPAGAVGSVPEQEVPFVPGVASATKTTPHG